MIIIVAILALVVVNALGESAWGVYSVGLTIPIALFMGIYLRFIRPGKVLEVSIIGFVLLMFAIISGRWIAETQWGAEFFHMERTTIAWAIIIYGFIAAILPVWLLLAPRDYLSTFMKIGVIALLAIAIIVVRPEINVPAVSEFASRSDGPVVAGSLFPFLFVTIACGALSGFHALISSGTTPKLVEKEKQTRFLGYGGMLVESFVAIMALVAAISIDRGIYFAMNASSAATGGTVETAVAFVNSLGLSGVHLEPGTLTDLANHVGEESVVSRTGGAPTLAVGIATIMHQWFGGTAMMGFWYHFAIMFEALFILTAVDAGTRVARFMLQDTIGNFVPKFKDTSWRPGAWLCTAIMVAGWGYILILGVTDPLGGINTFFPLFGISNQLLAAIALAIVMTIVAKRGNFKHLWVVVLPLAFTVVITFVASWQKIFSTDVKVGYFANHNAYKEALANGETSLGSTKSVEAMEAVVRNTGVQGWLSVAFLLLSVIVIVAAIIATVRAGTSTRPMIPRTRTWNPRSMRRRALSPCRRRRNWRRSGRTTTRPPAPPPPRGTRGGEHGIRPGPVQGQEVRRRGVGRRQVPALPGTPPAPASGRGTDERTGVLEGLHRLAGAQPAGTLLLGTRSGHPNRSGQWPSHLSRMRRPLPVVGWSANPGTLKPVPEHRKATISSWLSFPAAPNPRRQPRPRAGGVASRPRPVQPFAGPGVPGGGGNRQRRAAQPADGLRQ